MTLYSSQPDAAASDDTWAEVNNPTTNNDGTSNMEIRRLSSSSAKTIFIKFDLSSIPAGSTIDDATLYLTTNDSSSDRTIRAYRLLVPFVENEASWNIRSTGNNWSTAGGTGSGTDRSATESGNVALGSSANTEKAMTLSTSEVSAMVDGNNYGWVLICDEDTSSVTKLIHSADTTNSSRRPRLVINYTESSGSGILKQMIIHSG